MDVWRPLIDDDELHQAQNMELRAERERLNPGNPRIEDKAGFNGHAGDSIQIEVYSQKIAKKKYTWLIIGYI